MAGWLLKTEPGEYSFADLQRDKSTVWSGVSNAAALNNIRQMRPSDAALVYHTGDQKQIVGIARIASAPYPDPDLDDARRVVVDLKPSKALKRPVTLAQLKSDARFRDFALVRISRLSVMPVSPAQWAAIMKLAGESATAK